MTTPAGWYDDGSGRQRWWDGEQWTEHFAPAAEAAAQGSPAADAATEQAPADAAYGQDAAAADAASDATSSIDDTVIRPSADAAASDAAASDASASDASTSDASSNAAYTAPVESEPAAGADSGVPSYAAPYGSAAPQPDAPSYGSAPAYPGAEPAYGAAPVQPGAPGATAAYPVGGYPGGSTPGGDEQPKKLSVLGLVGLGLAVLGTILVFVPFVGAFGFVLLGVGFILSIISLFLKGKKWPGIAGLSLAVVGTILGIVMFFVYLVGFASSQVDGFPTDVPSEIATEDSGDADASDEPLATGDRPTADEVAVGMTDIMEKVGQSEAFTADDISCAAEEFVANTEISDDALRTIADGADAAFADEDALNAFTEHLPAAMMACAT